MDTTTEIQTAASETAESTDTMSAQQDGDETLSDGLSDPLTADAGSADAVQMILPPKPGKGPHADDTFCSVDEILASEV